MSADDIKLLPCPFCGGPAERQWGGEGESRRYGCSCASWDCVGHAMALRHRAQQDAIYEWNRRVPSPQGDAEPTKAPARFVVLKAAGSRYAYVNDTLALKTLRRFDIFKDDGWTRAEKFAAALNSGDAARTTPAREGE